MAFKKTSRFRHGKKSKLLGPDDPVRRACARARSSLRFAAVLHGSESSEWQRARAEVLEFCGEFNPPGVRPLKKHYYDPDTAAAHVGRYEPRCEVCERPAYKDPSTFEEHPLIYEGGHVFHVECEPPGGFDPSYHYGKHATLNTFASVPRLPRLPQHVAAALATERTRR